MTEDFKHVYIFTPPRPVPHQCNRDITLLQKKLEEVTQTPREKVDFLALFYPDGNLRDRPWIKSPPLNSNKKETSKAVGCPGSALVLPKGFTKDLPTFGNSASSSFYSATRALAEFQDPAHLGYFDNTKDFTELTSAAYFTK